MASVLGQCLGVIPVKSNRGSLESRQILGTSKFDLLFAGFPMRSCLDTSALN